jgi:lysophospholipase L1-like esterase
MALYLALGDSYTIGTGATTPAASFPSRLQARVRDATGEAVELVNPAVDGYTSEQLEATELPLLERVRPALVSLLIGANDVVQRRPLDAYHRSLRRIHDAIGAAGVAPGAVLAVSIPDWSVAPAAARFGDAADIAFRIAAFNVVARAEADARGAHWVDVTELSRRGGAGWLAADGLHPGDAQYAAWADHIWVAAGPRWAAAAHAR